MPTAVIFGASGQDGHYLGELYRRRGWDVVGVSRSTHGALGDVGSFEAVERLVRGRRPDVVYHVAARSTTSHDALFENHTTIGTGTLNLLEAVHRWQPACRVFITGSGVQFLNRGDPIRETDPFDATSCYSVERIQSVYAARYFRALGVRAYVGYLFHHESPLRKPTHVSQRVVSAVRAIAAGRSEPLELGDVSVEKEWGFAGDIAEGMAALVHQDDVYEAVIGTGRAYSIRDWLQVCFDSVGKDWREYTRIKNGFTPEYTRLVSDPATMTSLGWSARVGFEDLAAMMMRS